MSRKHSPKFAGIALFTFIVYMLGCVCTPRFWWRL